MKIILPIILLMIIPLALADQGEIETYKPNELFDLSIHLTNNTGEILGANCNVQIRNSSYNILLNANLTEIGGGWYNYTYNTSKVGKYYCRQNCTKGTLYAADTCDFIIGVEDNMTLGMLIFIPMFIALFLLVVSWMLDSQKYWALKLGMILLGFVFIFQSYQYGTVIIAEYFNNDNIINSLGDSTWIYGLTFTFIFSVFLITLIYDVFMLFSNKKHKTGDYDGE